MGFRKNWNAARLALVAVLVAASVATCRCDDSQAEKVYLEGRELAFGLNGAEVDEARGFELIEEAAEAGSLDAQATLALMLQRGYGTKIDPARAFETAIIPARRGNPYAQSVLAVCYRTGAGAEWNPKRAETYFEKAFEGFQKLAADGDVCAKNEIGRVYLNGNRGVEEDLEKAEKYLLEAAEEGLPDAWSGLNSLYERQEKEEEAFEAIRKAAASELPNAIVGLGLAYERGVGVERDVEKAAEYFRKAADLGDGVGALGLARYYDLGIGVEKNAKEAEKWLLKAVDLGEGGAMYQLSWFYTDVETKIKWLRKGVEYGNADSMAWLAHVYLGEDDFEQGLELARRSYSLASGSGAFILGLIYEQGLGVERDVREAVRLFRRGLELAGENRPLREAIAERLARWE